MENIWRSIQLFDYFYSISQNLADNFIADIKLIITIYPFLNYFHIILLLTILPYVMLGKRFLKLLIFNLLIYVNILYTFEPQVLDFEKYYLKNINVFESGTLDTQ